MPAEPDNEPVAAGTPVATPTRPGTLGNPTASSQGSPQPASESRATDPFGTPTSPFGEVPPTFGALVPGSRAFAGEIVIEEDDPARPPKSGPQELVLTLGETELSRMQVGMELNQKGAL